MVGGDIEQHCHIRLELVHIVELETAQFNHIHIVVLGSHLQREAVAHVASQSHIQPCFPQNVIGEHGGSGLAVAAGDAHHLGIGVATCKLNFADNRNILCGSLLHHWGGGRNARALDDFVGGEHFLFGVLALFPCYLVFVEEFLVFRCDGAHVAQPHVHTFHFGEYCGTCAAFATT